MQYSNKELTINLCGLISIASVRRSSIKSGLTEGVKFLQVLILCNWPYED